MRPMKSVSFAICVPVLSIMLGAGCAQDGDRPSVVTDGSGFFGAPWPEDSRTRDGRPDLTDFPLRDEVDIIDAYASRIEMLEGFGTNAPLYVPLDGPLEDIPGPLATTDRDDPILLVDIDPRSPERGQLVPLAIGQQTTDSEFQRRNMLAIQPVWGFPLRPATTYALILDDSVVQPSDDWRGRRDWSSLTDTLAELRIDFDRVAYALQFTTQDPVADVARAAAKIKRDVTLPSLAQALEGVPSFGNYSIYKGTMWLPMWQHGSKPYLLEGGGFVLDEEGTPTLSGWERASFTVSVPKFQDMPEEGWPLVIYGHGTGGDQDSFVQSGARISPAQTLAEAGIMGFGVSLPLHGDRAAGLDPTLASFNYLNPDSARSCFRQAALDQIYLAALLASQAHEFETSSGLLRTDPQRIAYMGHSHGGLIGAIAAPFFGDSIKAVFLSGAGGGLSTTLVTRDAGDFDIQEILESVLDFSETDVLEETHPVVAMVQTLAEATDPINYAPYWFKRTPRWDTSPQSVLMTEGMEDLQTPPATAEALAAAGGLPIVGTAAHVSTAHMLSENAQDATPTARNRAAADGTWITAGLVQFPGRGHFVIFQQDQAAELYQRYLETALYEGVPWIGGI